jgi:hypothetical protein
MQRRLHKHAEIKSSVENTNSLETARLDLSISESQKDAIPVVKTQTTRSQ